MSIQSSTNSLFGSVAALLSINPTLRMKAEERLKSQALARREETLSTASEQAAQGKDPTLAQTYLDDLADVRKEQFELDPTSETFEAYKAAKYHSTEGQKARSTTFDEEPEETAQKLYKEEQRQAEVESYLQQYRDAGKKAQDALVTKQEEKRAGRVKFKDVYDTQLASEGFDPSKIPADVKKEMMAQVKPSERRNMIKEYKQNEQK